MKRWIAFGWMACLVVLTVAGCPAENRPAVCTEDGDCLAGQACVSGECQNVECKLDSDCGQGEACVDHVCQVQTGCTSDGQCDLGEICVEPDCVIGCRADVDCPGDLLCIPDLGAHGTCADCRQDADCDLEEQCIGNQCRTQCQSSADCPDGVCEPVSGTCVDCLQDSQCPAGQVCTNNLCIPGCRDDVNCPPGEICEDGGCKTGCREGEDCPSGYCDPATWTCGVAQCSTNDDCELGQVCFEGTCETGCTSDRDCPDGQDCLTDQGEHGLCAECQQDADCAADLRCLNFQCTDQCLQDADCPGAYCHPQAQVCVDCVEDDHCGSGQICQDAACVAGCRDDLDCGTGSICEALSCRPGCRSDTDCSAGQICDALACRVGCRTDADCVNGTCDPGSWQCIGFDCNTTDDCQLGQLCIGHACVAGCEADRDCPEGTVCETDLGTHGTCVECMGNTDCPDPDYPNCINHLCEPECRDNTQCPSGQACIDLHCSVMPNECVLQIEPQVSVDFGAVPTSASLAIPFEFANQGAVSCTVEALSVVDNPFFPADFFLDNPPELPFVVGSAQVVVVDVVFAPAEAGSHGTYLWVETDDLDIQIGASDPMCFFAQPGPGQACIPLAGTGVLLEVQAVPSAVQFGPTTVGCGSSTESVRLYNLGGSLIMDDLQLALQFNSSFHIVSGPALPFTFQSGASVEVVLEFRPAATGSYVDDLLVSFDEPGMPDLVVPLSGDGVLTSTVTDAFELPPDVMVDVLWVVDNSGSMGPYQTALANNFGQFIDWALNLGVNFHVGVIATEVNDPETGQGTPPRDVIPGVLVNAPGRPKFITPSTPNPEDAFADNVQVGTCCSDEQEAGLEASWMALSPPELYDPTTNGGFVRADAKLYVIYVSNEIDQSNGPVDFFVDYFLTLKGGTERATLSAVCGDLPSGCGIDEASPAPRYHEALDATGGIFQSICSSNWSGLMDELGMDAFAPIRLYRLSRPAAQGTLDVRINGSLVPEASSFQAPDGWTYIPGENAIWFGDSYLPPAGADIVISYTAICL